MVNLGVLDHFDDILNLVLDLINALHVVESLLDVLRLFDFKLIVFHKSFVVKVPEEDREYDEEEGKIQQSLHELEDLPLEQLYDGMVLDFLVFIYDFA